jgi:hypothetical protein
MEKQQKYLQIREPDLPINVKRKSDSLGEANFMFVTTYHIIAQVVLFYRISGTDSFQLIWKNKKAKGKDPEGGL